MLDSILNPILSPLLKLSSLYAILIISFIISLIINVVYKFTTDQKLMKQLKDEVKELQEKVKRLKEKPEEAMKAQGKAMETNMKYMMESMKPTIFTLIPIIVLFVWLNAHLAYQPLMPDKEFMTKIELAPGTTGSIEIIPPTGIRVIGESIKEIKNNEASFTLKGKKGDYLLEYQFNNQNYYKELIISDERGEYAPVKKDIKKEGVISISLNNEKNVVLNLFGWKLGWLGAYIIFSLAFSMLLRKLMRLY